jgi:hypothetical protein
MKRRYTLEQIERWRDNVYRRTPRLAVTNKDKTIRFIDEVGFCFAFKSEQSELPCLWHAACGERYPEVPRHTHQDPFISFVWEMKDILPTERRAFYGKVLLRRPTFVSLEFLPYFYVLAGRNGGKDEYLQEFLKGRLSSLGKSLMEALLDSSPQDTHSLKIATSHFMKVDKLLFEKALTELQTKFFIAKSSEEHHPFSFSWAPMTDVFGKQIRKAARISAEAARARILERYFRNQMVASVQSIHRLFRWEKQDIFQSLGFLVNRGTITTDVVVEGDRRKLYCLVT